LCAILSAWSPHVWKSASFPTLRQHMLAHSQRPLSTSSSLLSSSSLSLLLLLNLSLSFRSPFLSFLLPLLSSSLSLLLHTAAQGMQCLPDSVPAMSSGDAKKKRETKLGLAHSKQTSFGDWYSEVVVESEMISYYDVSGKSPLVFFGNMPLVFLGMYSYFNSKTYKKKNNATPRLWSTALSKAASVCLCITFISWNIGFRAIIELT